MPQKRRARGSVDELPSGAYRVRVYADPLTGKRHDLVEVVPAGPKAAAEAEEVRTRLLNQLDERRNPRNSQPAHGPLPRRRRDDATGLRVPGPEPHPPGPRRLGRGSRDGEVLDSFYAQLRRCRARCNGRPGNVDHRVRGEHECTEKCRSHVCRPLAQSSIRKIHWVLSGALTRAVRWRWIAVNPAELASPTPNPDPPSPKQAAAILTEA